MPPRLFDTPIAPTISAPYTVHMALTMVLPNANSAFSAMTGMELRIIGSLTRFSGVTAWSEKLNALSPTRLFLTAKANSASSETSDATAIMVSVPWRM